jgi:hypothetical protein
MDGYSNGACIATLVTLYVKICRKVKWSKQEILDYVSQSIDDQLSIN